MLSLSAYSCREAFLINYSSFASEGIDREVKGQ